MQAIQSLDALKALLAELEVSQREYAGGIDETEVVVSRLLSGETRFTKPRIDKTLVFLTRKRRERRPAARPVTYEEAFGSPLVEAPHGR